MEQHQYNFFPMQISLDAEAIRNEKVKVLQAMDVVTMDDVVLGQYKGRQEKGGHALPGCKSGLPWPHDHNLGSLVRRLRLGTGSHCLGPG